MLRITINLYEHLIVIKLLKFFLGIPLEKSLAPQWTTHNVSLWEDAVSLSSDTDYQPLLLINQTRVRNAPDIEKMENETLRKLQILKVIYLNSLFLRNSV